MSNGHNNSATAWATSLVHSLPNKHYISYISTKWPQCLHPYDEPIRYPSLSPQQDRGPCGSAISVQRGHGWAPAPRLAGHWGLRIVGAWNGWHLCFSKMSCSLSGAWCLSFLKWLKDDPNVLSCESVQVAMVLECLCGQWKLDDILLFDLELVLLSAKNFTILSSQKCKVTNCDAFLNSYCPISWVWPRDMLMPNPERRKICADTNDDLYGTMVY